MGHQGRDEQGTPLKTVNSKGMTLNSVKSREACVQRP